jgi:hypothetical protein
MAKFSTNESQYPAAQLLHQLPPQPEDASERGEQGYQQMDANALLDSLESNAATELELGTAGESEIALGDVTVAEY